MSYYERIDKNVEPELARLWLDLVWFEALGKDFEDKKIGLED